MLYPLSYWSIFIAAPPTRSHSDSKIIAAERARLKRGQHAGVVNSADTKLRQSNKKTLCPRCPRW